MDPISQAVLGSVTAQAFVSPKRSAESGGSQTVRLMSIAFLAGLLGGMAADLDVVIRSSSDPLLAIQYHRHFTHSLAFIPLGGFIVGAVLFVLLWLVNRAAPAWIGSRFGGLPSLRSTILFATIGYATHGLLDACTSYGTQLFWPFSNMRVAWNNIGIIDPVPTLAWLIGSVAALKTRKVKWARVGLGIGLVYLGLGVVQRERARSVQKELITSRGHVAVRAEVKPTIFQTFVWKSIYEFDGKYYADAINVGFTPRTYTDPAHSSIEKFNEKALAEVAIPGSIQETDIARFTWFSDGWVARVRDLEPENGVVIGDIRYSMLPHQISPMWGIAFDAPSKGQPTEAQKHADFVNFRSVTDRQLDIFWKMILGQDIAPQANALNSNFLSNVISFPVNHSESGIDIFKTVSLMGEVAALFVPEVEKRGATFAWNFDWEKPWLGAGSNFDQNRFEIMLWGGIIRASGMTEEAFELILCHEFGHFLGGAPYQVFPTTGVHWSSTEGQSDWWAGTVCLPKIYLARGLSRSETRIRMRKAALDFALFNRRHFEKMSPLPSLEKVAGEIPFETLTLSYPSAQCRLDTYRVAAENFESLASAKNSDVGIPNALAALTPVTTANTFDTFTSRELRPRCWYVPLQ